MEAHPQSPAPETLLVAVNARFSHTNLAVRYLKNALEGAGIPAAFREYTINQPVEEILADLYRSGARRFLFSCYIWNRAYICRLGEQLRLIDPGYVLLAGGPEVSFDPEEQLAALPWADGILAGEGEVLVPQVLAAQWRPQGVFQGTGYVDLDTLPFPYEPLDQLPHRVLYYESSRGCPFGCAYCLSSADRVVRTRSAELVFRDLQKFLDARVMQVKFVDRTFNLDGDRALAIWEYLAAHDNGVTGFQMELGGDLTRPEAVELLRRARPGLFQLEIGVQSTCPAALKASCRATDLPRLFANVRAVGEGGNVHQHLDLIAGLPGEGFARFGQSFDEVFALRPQQLQLGFLKLLRGSALYAQRERYGLVHSPQPPYQVLRTPWISYGELTRLKAVERAVELYYNSGRFTHTLEALLELAPSPFGVFLELGEALPAGHLDQYRYYDLLYGFCLGKGGDPERFRWLLKWDLCLHERPRKLPACLAGTLPPPAARRWLAAQPLPAGWEGEWFARQVAEPGCPPGAQAVAFCRGQRDLAGHLVWRRLAGAPGEP
ncbi:MAG TPA: DUF4080 domain-containing protein [Candidatus Anaerotruncus excrementipullorum]|uniref:DUF4080 domain-containing protein n=1 Tax=Candidatus Anaerotruncus excrementipullorum TaxID=2838465 RepID=A0A9D1WPZ8_9FIRM|nr:DUF4080 domain-containing protein [Candidatus Anaerotruncus excrementipullorum]